MDPLSITAACSSLAFAIARNGRALANVHEKYKNARHSIFMIQTECTVLAAALSHLQLSVSNRDISQLATYAPSILEALDLSLTGCTLTLSVLEKEITQMTGGEDLMTVKLGKSRRAQYVWKEESMNELLQQLRGQSSAVTLLLKALDSSSIDQILSIVQSGQPTFQRVRSGAASIRNAYPEQEYAESILNMPLNDSETIYSLETSHVTPVVEDISPNPAHDISNQKSTDLEVTTLRRCGRLPEGWETFYSKEIQQQFYVQASERKVSWEHPNKMLSSSQTVVPFPHQTTAQWVQKVDEAKGKAQDSSVRPAPVNTTKRRVKGQLDLNASYLETYAIRTPVDFEKHLDSLLKQNSVAATAVGIVSADEPPELFVRGVRRIDNPARVTRSDRFHTLGSERMISIVAAIMIEKGFLSWDDKIVDLISSLTSQAHASHSQTTMEMLMSHRSGITTELSSLEEENILNYLENPEADSKQARLTIASLYLKRAPNIEPGTKTAATFVNDVLVACALEAASGQSAEFLLKRFLFDPLEMYSVGPRWSTDIQETETRPTQPWPHLDVTKQPLKLSQSSRFESVLMFPFTELYSSGPDFASYVRFQLRCSMGLQTPGILQAETARRICHSALGREGKYNSVGWYIMEATEGLKTYLEATHLSAKSNSDVILFPYVGKAYFVLCNLGGEGGHQFNHDVMDNLALYDELIRNN